MAGVETWDANGNPTLGITDRVAGYLGYFDVAAGAATSGSLSVPALAGLTLWDQDTAGVRARGEKVKCTQAGTTINWTATYRSGDHRIFYGGY